MASAEKKTVIHNRHVQVCALDERFSPSILAYSLVSIPLIWQLELNRDTSQSTSSYGGPIQLSNEIWTYVLEQSFLLCIIFGRWILPKGSLSRANLSNLLLILIGKACDITDFFTLINEEKVRNDSFLVYVILSGWTVSVFQFTLVLSETKTDAIVNSSHSRLTQIRSVFLGTDVWSCAISVVMEELPFLIIRAYTIATHDVTSYNTLFFITKNSLLLIMLFYRIISVCFEVHENTRQVFPISEVHAENKNGSHIAEHTKFKAINKVKDDLDNLTIVSHVSGNNYSTEQDSGSSEDRITGSGNKGLFR